jgi:hypothetical protein
VALALFKLHERELLRERDPGELYMLCKSMGASQIDCHRLMKVNIIPSALVFCTHDALSFSDTDPHSQVGFTRIAPNRATIQRHRRDALKTM